MLAVKTLLVLFFLILMISCNSSGGGKDNENVDIKIFKSKDGLSYLDLQSYHFENKIEKYYSVYQINNLIFNKHELENLNLNVLNGKFKISGGAIGKKWNRLKEITINKGDSLVIKFYLKDEDSKSEHFYKKN